jgi:hypothetical protein
MKTTIKTPATLIVEKDNLISDNKKNWSIISNSNVFNTGTIPNFDINAVYKNIIKNENLIILKKVSVQAANCGFDSVSVFPKNSPYYSIYELQQVKERIVKLSLIPTKKEEGETVTFTRKFITTEIEKLRKQQELLEKKLEVFNTNSSFEE